VGGGRGGGKRREESRRDGKGGGEGRGRRGKVERRLNHRKKEKGNVLTEEGRILRHSGVKENGAKATCPR
jgi:hypothetical protein